MTSSSTPKSSKIPVLKKVKILKPLKNNDVDNNNCCEDQFRYCRNCNVLKEIICTLEQNFTALLKENNFLRQQLTMVNQPSTPNSLVSQHENLEVIDPLIHNPQTQKDVNLDQIKSDEVTLQPFLLLPNHPFSEFNVNILDEEITYSHDLYNRKVKFYGDVPYKYSNIVHQPCSIPEDCYLIKIIDKVNVFFPNITFNSVLDNKYDNGDAHIPMHSDDEECIKPNSNILTVSLGETRTINFQPKNRTRGSEVSISLQHGDVFLMSTCSQELFRHGISKDNSKCMRISLTFRDLIYHNTDNIISPKISNMDPGDKFLPNDSSMLSPCMRSPSEADNLQQIHQQSTAATILPTKKVDTIYISSSMFADLDHTKLTSRSHTAAVFFYRGATAAGILHKLQNDPNFNDIDASNIKQVFLLCGTNDIDNILKVKRSDHSNGNIDLKNYDNNKFEKTTHDIYNLVHFLHNRNVMTEINILNILPRASLSRNTVINHLNQYLMNLCNHTEYLSFINTEFKICLFSSYDGYRINTYFKNKGSDNVHLNKAGIVRLGRHLKYLSHLDCPRINTWN